MLRLVVIALLLAGAAPAGAQEEGSLDAADPRVCDLFEADSTEVVGRLIELTFPGPPNYESVVGGDRPVTVFVVVLPTARCRALENNLFWVQLLQLQVGQVERARLKRLLSREVRVSGPVRQAEIGPEFTGLIMDLKTIEALTPSRR